MTLNCWPKAVDNVISKCVKQYTTHASQGLFNCGVSRVLELIAYLATKFESYSSRKWYLRIYVRTIAWDTIERGETPKGTVGDEEK